MYNNSIVMLTHAQTSQINLCVNVRSGYGVYKYWVDQNLPERSPV